MKRTMIVAALCATLVACGAAAKSASPDRQDMAAPSAARESGFGEGIVAEEAKRNAESPEAIKPAFHADFSAVSGRLLEYKISLSYRSNDVLKSREILLGLVERYGFFRSSSTTSDADFSNFSSELMIETKKLSMALADFSALGVLLRESVAVVDHTPAMAQTEIKRERQEIRIVRRSAAVDKAAVGNRNFSDIEGFLAAAEDQLDAARFERWSIEDRTKWATVTVSVDGPLAERAVNVPDYREAFISLAEFCLKLAYGVIELIPLWILLLVVILKRKAIVALFAKGRKPPENKL